MRRDVRAVGPAVASVASCPGVASGARRERRGEKWAPGIIFAHKESLTVLDHSKLCAAAQAHTRRGGRAHTVRTMTMT